MVPYLARFEDFVGAAGQMEKIAVSFLFLRYIERSED